MRIWKNSNWTANLFFPRRCKFMCSAWGAKT
jgi:hypothetical protein